MKSSEEPVSTGLVEHKLCRGAWGFQPPVIPATIGSSAGRVAEIDVAGGLYEVGAEGLVTGPW